MPDEFDYLIFDGDNHLYEGPDAFTRKIMRDNGYALAGLDPKT